MSDTMSADDYQKRFGKKTSERKPSGLKPRKANQTPMIVQIGSGTVGDTTELIFPMVVPGMNGKDGLLRMPGKERVRLRNLYHSIVSAHRPKPHSGPVRVELIRHSIGSEMDRGNLVSTEKLLLDAIVKAGVLPDDNNDVITERDYKQTRALNQATQMTVIRIISLNPK